MDPFIILMIVISGLSLVAFGGVGYLTGKSAARNAQSLLPVALVLAGFIVAVAAALQDWQMAIIPGSWLLGLLIGRLQRRLGNNSSK